MSLVTLDALVLAPALAPAAAVVLVLVGDAVRPPRDGGGARWPTTLATALLLVGAAFAVRGVLAADDAALRTLCLADGRCLWTADARGSALQAGVLLAAAASLAVRHDAVRHDAAHRGGGTDRDSAVTATLLLAATTGGVAVAAARDLGSWLVALELATVPAVALVALRGTRAAAHGALSLLVTSLVSFALLVLGAALWVTATGDAAFAGDTVSAAWADPQRRAVLVLALTALVAGLGFKLSLVPFHAWTPQAYRTADLGTALFLAAASKLAALAALLVPVGAVVAAGVDDGRVVVLIAAPVLASLVLGTVVALRQDEPVRLLAWSTVAQAGWLVLPLTALREDGLRAAAAYGLVYAVATTVAFAAVARTGARRLSDHRGLLRRDPLAGGALALALLVLAGLPPGVVGLVAKVVALAPPVRAGTWPVVVAGVLAVVVGIAVYLRWFAALLGAADRGPTDAARDDAGVVPTVRRTGAALVLVLGTVLLVVTSVLPHLLLDAVS